MLKSTSGGRTLDSFAKSVRSIQSKGSDYEDLLSNIAKGVAALDGNSVRPIGASKSEENAHGRFSLARGSGEKKVVRG